MKYIVFSILLMTLFYCSKAPKDNPFVNIDTYNIISKSINELKNDKITAGDSIYYLFQHNDSLIIASLNEEKFKVTTNAKKIGYYKINNNRIVITKEINPKYDIFELSKSLSPVQNQIHRNDNFKPDYLKGIVYKIIKDNNRYTFKKEYKGNLMSIFRNKKEYTIPIVK